MITRRQLGAQRLEGFVQAQAQVQATLFFACLTVMATPATRYSSEAIEQMKNDADEVVQAAAEFREFVVQLAERWEAQREELES